MLDGFSTVQQPAASTGASFHAAIRNGSSTERSARLRQWAPAGSDSGYSDPASSLLPLPCVPHPQNNEMVSRKRYVRIHCFADGFSVIQHFDLCQPFLFSSMTSATGTIFSVVLPGSHPSRFPRRATPPPRLYPRPVPLPPHRWKSFLRSPGKMYRRSLRRSLPTTSHQ